MVGKVCGSVSIFDRFGKELEMVRRGRASEAFGLRSFVILYYIEKEVEMGYTIDQIEQEANEIRRKYGADFNVVQAAKDMGFTVYDAQFKNPNVAGKIVSSPNEKAIYVNKFDIPARKKFTVAHEIGHAVLHHGDNDGEFKMVDYRGMNKGFDRKEWEANQFAASLLMPKDETTRKWGELQDVDDLAEAMGVSKMAAAIRLMNLGLID